MALTLDISIFPSTITLSSAVTLTTYIQCLSPATTYREPQIERFPRLSGFSWIFSCGRAASPVWCEPPVQTDWATLFINYSRSALSKPYTSRIDYIQCLSPAKNHKLYKSSINKSIHFAQRRLSNSTRVQVQRVTAQFNLSREWKNRMTTVVISAILNPVSRVSTPH